MIYESKVSGSGRTCRPLPDQSMCSLNIVRLFVPFFVIRFCFLNNPLCFNCLKKRTLHRNKPCDKFCQAYQLFRLSMQKQYFDPRIFSGLLNTGVTPGQKVVLPGSFEPELSLLLVQSCVSSEYLMNARLGFAWAVAVVIE